VTASSLELLHQRAGAHSRSVVQLNVRVPSDIKERLDAVVRQLGVNAGEYLSAVLEDALALSENRLASEPPQSPSPGGS
jgi:hypothetical protein